MLLAALPAFFMLNVVCAPFRVRRRERGIGNWFGHRFVYHEPVRLLTAFVDASDNSAVRQFEVTDAEPDTVVSYFIELDRADGRARAGLAWANGERAIPTAELPTNERGAFRLPKGRRMALLTQVAPEATLTTVRVYMTGWEIGRGDGRG